jgi:predicted metal-dependent peptidase
MGRWKAALREISAEARLHIYARSLKPNRRGFHLAALCSAFVAIAAAVLGTLSIHSF